jgi:hypothetical protein
MGTLDTPEGVKKIDELATKGLLGVKDSAAYRANEIERHLHNREKWFGKAVVPNLEVHVADRMDGVVLPFTLTSGNSAFGSWVQLLGSSDTPVSSGSVMLDAHRFMVTTTDSISSYIIHIASGELADLAAKVAVEQFTEAPYKAETNNNDSGISNVMSIRIAVGEKVWARCACVGGNAQGIDFYYGIHEYEG